MCIRDRSRIATGIQVPSGYWINWGGTFEQMQSAVKRLEIVVPVALLLIFMLLFAMFNNKMCIRDRVSANAGDRVRKGQVLAVVSSQSLADQRSEWLATQKRLTLTRTTYEREKKLWEEKISSEQDYLQARGAMQEAEIAVQGAQQKLASLGGQGSGGDLTRYELRSPIDLSLIHI